VINLRSATWCSLSSVSPTIYTKIDCYHRLGSRGAEGIELVIEGETVEAIDTTAHRTKL